MKAAGVDGIISATLENNFYLSGVWDDGQELFPLDGEFYAVATADAPEAGIVVCSIGAADLTLGGYPTLKDVVTFGTFFRDMVDGVSLNADEQRVLDITTAHQVGRSAVDALAEAITSLGLADGTIAVDERGPNRNLLAALAEKLPGARFQPASTLFRAIRAVKTAEEIERVTQALRITEAGLRAAWAEFAEGVSEKAVQNAFERAVTAEGGRTGFCLVRFGKGLALGQIPASEDIKLAANDFAFFDVGIKYRGYRSDIGRLVVLRRAVGRAAVALRGVQGRPADGHRHDAAGRGGQGRLRGRGASGPRRGHPHLQAAARGARHRHRVLRPPRC